MPYEFKFPDVGEGIHEGEIVKWLVKEGDKINADQPLGEIETDKAIVEMPSPKTGKILKIHVPAGGTIHVGETMVTILVEGETEEDARKHMETTSTKSGDVPYTGSVVGFLEEAKDVKPIQSQAAVQAVKTASESGIQATPAVRSLAKQINIDLNSLKGSGPGGRITIEDVQKATSSEKKEEPVGIKVVKKYDFFGYIERVKLHGVKKATASKMTDSLYTAPQLTNIHEADVTDLSKFIETSKKDYEKEGIKITMLPFIVKAVAEKLKDHPYLNASLEGEEIVLKKYHNIGVAVDSDDGLVVPVVKAADAKDIKIIAKEIMKLANDVRSHKLNLMDLKGGSFTISNLGSVGVKFFTPILNYPESALLGIGRREEKPVVKNGKIEVRKILPLSLTYDHRIVDGAQAARFAIDVIKKLENCDF